MNGKTVRVSETTVNTRGGAAQAATNSSVADNLRAQAQQAADADAALAYVTMEEDDELAHPVQQAPTPPRGWDTSSDVVDTSGPEWEDDYSTPPPPGAVFDEVDGPGSDFDAGEFAAFEDAFNDEFVDQPNQPGPAGGASGPHARGRGRGRQNGMDYALRAMATRRGSGAQQGSQPGGLKFNPDSSIFGRLFKGLGGGGGG